MDETDHGLTPQIPDLKVNRNLSKINELPTPPPRQCWGGEPSLIAPKTKVPQAEREKARELRLEIALLRTKDASLASINEVLLDENRTLKSRLGDPKVVGIPKRP